MVLSYFYKSRQLKAVRTSLDGKEKEENEILPNASKILLFEPISPPIARNIKALPLPAPTLPTVFSETRVWGLNTYGSSWSIPLSSEAVNSDGHKSASAKLQPQTRTRSHSSPGVWAEIWPHVFPLHHQPAEMAPCQRWFMERPGGQSTVASYHPNHGALRL